MLKRLFNNLDDIDPKKLVEVVNLVWNNRDRIRDVIERLPGLLRDTGKSIELAGQSAVKASRFLGGKESQEVNAGKLSEQAATALDHCYREMARVAEGIEHVSNEIGTIRIPSFRPRHTEIAGVRVLTGVEMSDNALVENASDRLRSGAGRIAEISRDLETVARNLRQLGGALTETGGDLHTVGTQLQRSGQTLRSFTDSNYTDPKGFALD
jgi:ABC-type transporter Mla subunit MlaD